VIRVFHDRRTAALFAGKLMKGVPADVAKVARRKLLRLDAARSLDDLRAFRGDRLEALRGDREGQHSLRVNDQFRLCFVWREGGAERVEFVD